MLEIPQKLAEIFNRLLYDFDYFTYSLLNGGWVGLISIPFLIIVIRGLKQGGEK